MLAISLSALMLGLACGVLYSAGDYFRKAVPASCPSETILFYYIGGQLPVLTAWVLWTGETGLSLSYLGPGLLDAAFGLAANLLFIVSIRRSPLSLMIPLLALVPVAALLVGGMVLGEWPTLQQDIGIILIAAGLFILFQPPGAQPGLSAAWRTLKNERGTAPMLGVILFWAATPSLDKLCLAYASPGMHGLMQVALIWTALLVWSLARGVGTLRISRGAAGPVGGAAVTGALAYLLQLFAYSIAMVALIEVIKRTVGLLLSLVLGRAAFREPLTGLKVAGIAIIAAGLALVMLG
jgi:drug/metabolite transporter (DMT)-like permease